MDTSCGFMIKHLSELMYMLKVKYAKFIRGIYAPHNLSKCDQMYTVIRIWYYQFLLDYFLC